MKFYKIYQTYFNCYNIEIVNNKKYVNIGNLTTEQVIKIADLLTTLNFKDNTEND